jgi:DNA helicase HerA-like ATPase
MDHANLKSVFLGKTDDSREVSIPLASMTRHGLIAGATGTGKTVTLKVIIESLSAQGVPVIAPDIKGDLAGLCENGHPSDPLKKRAEKLGISWTPEYFPVALWRLGKGLGHPVRTTPSDLGPILLGRLLGLNETQVEILSVLFEVADAEGLLLLDADDLHALLQWSQENAKALEKHTGALPKASLATIQRKLTVEFSRQTRDSYSLLGEPALALYDMIRTNSEGSGLVNIIDCTEAVHDQALYSAFLLWFLSELFEELPEVGDLEKPKAVIFLDEAHLLFETASTALLEKIVMVVRLIRSRGVSLFFATQHPHDIPEPVLAQLSTRIQHGMRVYSPKQEKALKATVSSLPANPQFDAYTTMLQLGVGEALVSTLDSQFRPTPVEKTIVAPPRSNLGAPSASSLERLMSESLLHGKYEQELNRESAAELLAKRVAKDPANEKPSKPKEPGTYSKIFSQAAEGVFRSFVRGFGYRLANEVTRGVLGSLRRR